ncbi:MAG: Trk system potassium transporter TrkA [Patescibacteria group bacterium]
MVVVGAGKLGYDISRILSGEQHDVIVIDKDHQALKAITQDLDVLTVTGNGASVKTLQEAEIGTADIMLAVTDNDELNMIACMTAKQSGVGMTVARVRNPDYTSSHPIVLLYNSYGIDMIINPEYLAAQEIYRLIEVPMALDIEYFADGKLSLIGVRIDKNLAISGKRIKEMGIKTLTILAVIRQDQVIIPDGNTEFLPNDKVFVLGQTRGLHELNGFLQKNVHFQRILIGGGGRITRYLARMLQNRKTVPDIRIIEPSMERCREMAVEFDNCAIVCGDPDKSETLREEHLGANDIFIALTESDNTNLVACLQAKMMGAKEIICATTREDYIVLAEAAGATATVTPRLLTASTLLKLVRRSNIVSLNLLHLGDAVILELIAGDRSRATAGRLTELNLPRDVVIGAVIHEGDIIVPRGDTIIHPGDHVVVAGLKEHISQIEGFFQAKTSLAGV